MKKHLLFVLLAAMSLVSFASAAETEYFYLKETGEALFVDGSREVLSAGAEEGWYYREAEDLIAVQTRSIHISADRSWGEEGLRPNADTQVVLLNESGVERTYVGRSVIPVMTVNEAVVVLDEDGKTVKTVYCYAERYSTAKPVIRGRLIGEGTVEVLSSDGIATAVVKNDGFAFSNFPAGKYTVRIRVPGCLTYTVENATVLKDNIVSVGTVEPLAGDVNGDDMINIMDMAAFRQNFGKTGEAILNPYTDTNGDGMVNIMDMGTFRANFGRTAAKDCTFVMKDPEGEQTAARSPMMFVYLGEETMEGTEATFWYRGERETYLVKDTSLFTRAGLFFWGTAEGNMLTVEPVTPEDPDVVSGNIGFLDSNYLEIEERGLEMADKAVVYQMNNAGDKVTIGTAATGKNVVAILNEAGSIAELYQYKGEILAW